MSTLYIHRHTHTHEFCSGNSPWQLIIASWQVAAFASADEPMFVRSPLFLGDRKVWRVGELRNGFWTPDFSWFWSWFGWVLTWKNWWSAGDRLMVQTSGEKTTWDVKCLVNIGINYQPQLVSRSSSVNRSGDINMNKTFICPWPCCSPRHLPFWVARFDEFFRISTVGWEMNTKLDS